MSAAYHTAILLTVMAFGFQAQAWKITQLQGDVKIASGDKIRTAKLNDELKEKDIIATAEDGKALIEDKGAKIFVAAKSKIQIKTTATDKSTGEFTIDMGKIRGLIEKQMSGKEYPYRFRTLTAVMGVRGTEFFIAQDGADEKFCTLDGVIHVELIEPPKDKHKPSWWDLSKGQGLFVIKGKVDMKNTSEEDRAKWLKLTSF